MNWTQKDIDRLHKKSVAPIRNTHNVPFIFIPGEVPSSKNSRIAIQTETTNKTIPSKATRSYKKESANTYKDLRGDFHKMVEGLHPPFTVYYKLVRKRKAEFDFHNAIQIIADMMVLHGWLQNDDSKTVRFIPLLEIYDSENPGVYITI